MLDLIASALCFQEVEVICRHVLFSYGSLFFIIPIWSLCLSYFKIEKIRKNLKRSWRIITRDEYIGWDPISRSWAIRDVIGAFAFPDQSIKLGLLSAEDYAEFPRKLKVVLRGLGVCSVASLLGVLLLLLIGDIVGWADVDWVR